MLREISRRVRRVTHGVDRDRLDAINLGQAPSERRDQRMGRRGGPVDEDAVATLYRPQRLVGRHGGIAKTLYPGHATCLHLTRA